MSPVNQLFDQIHKLPQIPEVVRALISQLNDPNALVLDIAQNVEKEQVIALKILRLVNSAHFGLSRKISSIQEATTILGMNQLKTLVIASGLVASAPKLENFDIKQFWSDNFRGAACAKWFAEQANEPADLVYSAALFSGLGILLIQMGMPSEANEIDQHFKAGHHWRSELEQNRLGFSSQMVCAELCRRWKLPVELIEAIEQSDQPLAVGASSRAASCVYLARYLIESLQLAKTPPQILETFPMQVADSLGLDAGFIERKLDEVLAIESKLDALAD